MFLPDHSTHFTCIDSLLYIIWLAVLFSLACKLSWSLFGHDVGITIHPDCHRLCVDVSDISCTLLDCMLHDCPPSAWLHVVCLCGSHFYPPTSNSLGFGHSFHLGSHYCKCEAFSVLALWPSRRLGVGSSDGLYWCLRAFWRRPICWYWLESDRWRPV